MAAGIERDAVGDADDGKLPMLMYLRQSSTFEHPMNAPSDGDLTRAFLTSSSSS